MKESSKTKSELLAEISILKQNNQELDAKHKRVEEELRENEEYAMSLFANSYIPLIVMDAETGIYIDCNAAAVQIYGYASREDVLGKTPLDVSAPIQYNGSDSATEAQKHIKIGREKGSHIFEWRHQRPNGQIWDAYVHLMLLQYRGKSLIQFMLQDITERKRMEGTLKESERRLTDIIDFLPDATFVIDHSGKVIAWNRAMEEMTGIKTEDVLGKGDYEYAVPLHGTPRPILIDQIMGVAVADETKYAFVKREGNVLLAEGDVTLRGAPYTIWGKAGPLYDSKGNIAGAIESIRDVTELKKAQEALQKAHDELEAKVRERTAELVKTNDALHKEISGRKRTEVVLKESEEKYNQFFKTSRDCVFITKDRSLIDINDASVELFGYSSREELLQVNIPDLYAEPEEWIKHFNIISECGYYKEYPVDFRRKDGSIRRTLVTSAARCDTNGNLIGFQGTVRDVTEQRRNEEELRKYREDLEALVSERTSDLEKKTNNLQEVNTTLSVLLQKREEDKNILEERFVANIGGLVLPYVEMIKKNNLDAQQQLCLDIIGKNLDKIITPLLKNIQQFNLTPREVQIASLINDGKTTKEIANILGIAKGSIDTHRKNIRKKLGLDRTSNLQSRLLFLEK